MLWLSFSWEFFFCGISSMGPKMLPSFNAIPTLHAKPSAVAGAGAATVVMEHPHLHHHPNQSSEPQTNAQEMDEHTSQHTVRTYVCALQECGRSKTLEDGMKIHAHIRRHRELKSDMAIAASLVSMYAKCGSLLLAQQVFDTMPTPSLGAVNNLALGFVKQGKGFEGLKLFQAMRARGLKPDATSFVAMANACAQVMTVELGKELHEEVKKAGYDRNVFVMNSLIDMYSKCRMLKDALRVFKGMWKRDVVSWNAIIGALVKHGQEMEALKLFHNMKREGLKPDSFTFVSVLNACASLGAIELGKQIHSDVICKPGCGYNSFVVAALVDMYAKCRCLREARKVFDGMHKPTAAAWTSLISGYVRGGHAEEALKLSQRMLHQEQCIPDALTYVSVLNACASLAVLEHGIRIHCDIVKNGLHFDLMVSNALIDMYAKCGDLNQACKVFDSMSRRNVVSWTAMISGCAFHGYGKEAIKLFREMQQQHVEPNQVTFIGVLSACSHLGLVDEGLEFFRAMTKDHGLTALPEHYGCMVDLFCKAGHFGHANDFIQRMPIPSDSRSWTSLLAASKVAFNLELSECIAERAFKLKPQQVGCYLLLCDIYASVGRWDKKIQLRKMLEERAIMQDEG